MRRIVIDENDMRRLKPLLENAIREGEDSLDPDALIRPENPIDLLESIGWAKVLLGRITENVWRPN